MKRFVLVSTAVYLLTTASCSWITSFVVLNYSREPISVQYSVEPHQLSDGRRGCLLAPPFEGPPKLMPARKVGKDLPVNHMKAASEFTLDESLCAVELKLLPNQGVEVWKLGTGGPEGEYHFLNRLTLTSPHNMATYDGTKLAEVFERRSKVLYVLTYGQNSSG